jgi:CubicO group peptidase (beta-lactamase class C family)
MFDIQRFAKKLDDQLIGRVVGYEYAVYQGEVLSCSGAAGYAELLTHTPMTADRRMTVSSMSKTITATAFMRAMEMLNTAGANLSLDTKIAQYLPRSWVRGPHVEEMTFKHLLTHTSGLRSIEGDEDLFDVLGQTIDNGSTQAHWQVEKYQNCNFSLFRILIPNLLYGPGASQQNILQSIGADYYTARIYFNFVRDKVFGPVGLSSVSLAPNGPQEVGKYYNFNNIAADPYQDPDFDWHLLRVGSGHWFMSAKEFGRFIAGLRNGKIVSNASFQQMTSLNLGMGPDSSTRGGMNWNHNGEFKKSNGSMTGDWMILPNGISTVILANSFGGLNKTLEEIIRNAFNAAWLTPATTSTAPGATTFGERLHVVIKGEDNHMYLNSAADRQLFDGWMEVEGQGTTGLAPAAASLNKRIFVFAIGTNDQRLYVTSALFAQPFDGFSKGWTALPDATTDASPAAASLGNRIYVFAKGVNDKQVYVNSAVDGQAFDGWNHGWQVVSGITTNTAPAAAALGNRLYVFAKSNTDNRIYVNSAVNGQAFDGWGQGWQAVPGIATNVAPAAATLNNRLYIFAKGITDNRIYVSSAADGQAFGRWQEVEGNGTTDAALGAAALGGRIYVFAKGLTDKRIYVNSAAVGQPFDGWGNGWSEVHG